MKKSTIVVLALLVVVVGAIALSSNKPKQQASTNTNVDKKIGQPEGAMADGSLVIGDPKAKTTIVEYADFQCPKCNKFFKGAQQDIRRDYVKTGKAKIEYRTLVTIGPESKIPAAGAYCANDQKKFTAYHDAVYNYMSDSYYSQGKNGENVGALAAANVKTIAGSAGLEQAAFDSCLDSGKYTSKVDEVIAAAGSVSSTPTVVVGTQKVENAQPYAIYKTLLESL